MAIIPRELEGTLFDNRSERTSKRQPDYRGAIKVNDITYQVAGWYNPPTERSAARINLKIEDPAETQRRRQEYEQRKATQASSDAPTQRQHAEKPAAGSNRDFYEDNDIPF